MNSLINNNMNKMKINKIFLGLAVVVVVVMLNSCTNDDITFPDFDYQTVYFANQYPVRTLVLGEDLFVDTSIDNLKRVEIKATMGGAYENKNNIVIDFDLADSLCDDLYFSNGDKIIPMPSSYYELASSQITIPKGNSTGGVQVQLTDAFFADPQSLVNTYVIPLVMNHVQGADSILRGIPQVDNPDRLVAGDWTIQPKDFVLYAIKYINPWHGNYLRRGVDQITSVSGTTTSVRHAEYVNNDELVKVLTNSLNQSTLSLSIHNEAGILVYFDVLLTFANDGTCTLSGNTNAYEVSGNGKFVEKGEKKSFGDYDRNALYLDYTVNFKTLNLQYATKDTLVVRDRGVSPEYFEVVKK